MDLSLGPGAVPAGLIGGAVGLAIGLWWRGRARRAAPPPTTAPPTESAPPPVELDSLVATVAHEIRNPLFSLSATLDAFEARFGALPEHEPYTRVFRSELVRIRRLVEMQLEYGRPGEPAFSRAPLEPVLRQALDLAAPVLAAAGATLAQERAPGLPAEGPELWLDRERLARAVRHLLENAAAASPPGGRITLAVRPGPSGSLLLEVLDEGSGFPAGEERRLMEPFARARRGGAGLGLAIAQRAAVSHGGDLDVGNRPEGGGRQTLRLPRGVPPGAAGAGDPAAVGADGRV